MQSNVLEAITGAIVLVVGAILLVFAYVKTKGTDSADFTISANFERIDGLSIGNDVRMSGIKIGKVVSQSIDPDTYMAKVTVAVDPTLKIPSDSSASIASEGLLGGKYVDISPGGAMENLQAGEAIEHTQSSVNLESLIGKMIFSKNEAAN